MTVRANDSQRRRSGGVDPRPDPRLQLPEPPTTTILDDIARQTDEQPNHPALDDGTTTLTYRQLWDRAGTIAEHLAAQGVTTGTPVLIWGPRTTAFAAATLATLRAGAVAVPCSTMLPDARCATMATEARATHAITIGHTPTFTTTLTTLELDTNAQPTTPNLPTATPAPPGPHAYIFFTSGTTGTPKAVLGRHASLTQYLTWWRDAFTVTAADRVSMVTSTAFDVTLRNLFGPLTSGATACIAPDGLLPEHGLDWLAEAAVSVLHVTPSLAGSWLAEAEPASRAASRALRWTLFAGEMLNDTLVTQWRAANPGAVANMYGPTETTMSRCLYVVPDAPEPGPQPVGTPLPGTQVLVVDANDQLCAVNEPGEVLIRTRGGTAGYANNAAEQAARFTANPFTGDADDFVYRTGDIGWYRPDGTIQLAGRTDDQVKIGGVRVEPAEVTAALVRHPDVRAANVQPHLLADGHHELVAFIVSSKPPQALGAQLRRHCGQLLAPAAIPARFVHVDRLPMTSNGKVDRAALVALLDAPSGPSQASLVETEEPADADDDAATVTIDELVTLWREVLRREDIGPDTNFFEVGGSSVTAVRLAHRLHERVGRALTIHDLLDAQTPLELTRLLGGTTDEQPTNRGGEQVHERVRHHAHANPHASALTDGHTTMSYGELETRVRAVAGALAARGVEPGSLVALHATRNVSLIPVLLGIHRAGAGYVPIDPDLPTARVAMLLDDCTPAAVISDRPLPDRVGQCPVLALADFTTAAPPLYADDDTARSCTDECTAYVIYTSGSTGKPKGVLVSQRSLTSYVDASNERYGVTREDRFLQYHSMSFDSSVEEIFVTLAVGATLVMPTGSLLGGAGWFVEVIDELGITVMGLPTAFWAGLVTDLDEAALDLPARLRTVIIGGQAARAEIVNQWNTRLGRHRSLFNSYGPTEVTIAATIADLTGARFASGELVPIGAPLSSVLALVLDEHDRPVDDGASGELLLGGPQVATGYHDRPELTAQRFVTDPTGATTETYYRTGDRVHRLTDGQLVFESRVDDQVKIRGFRIELGEIEAVLQTHPGVREAVAIVAGTADDPTITAHVMLQDGAVVDIAALRAHAAATLPSYALPATIELRTSLPRTPGGKPDRRALRAAVRAPLGFAQEQQWFLHKLDPESAAYNLTAGLRLRGPLDHDALDHALSVLVERHEALRTRYLEHDDTVVQVVDDPVTVRAERVTPDHRDDEDAEGAARRAQLELGGIHFDLGRDALFRPVVIRIGPDDHVLALRSHHVALDGWSFDVLIDELMAVYSARFEGRSATLEAVAIQPRELAAAERAAEVDGTLDATIEWWAERLTPLPPPLALPLDRPRPSAREPLGSLVRVRCSDNSGQALAMAARTSRTTPFAVGLTLFGAYLAARCASDDLVIGVPSADRDTPGSDRAVAMLVNTLPHRVRAHTNASVRDAIATTTRSMRDALAHKNAPFDRIVRRVRPPRVPGLHPIFQVTFQTSAAPKPYGTMGMVEVAPFPSSRTGAKFDVSCNLVVGDELECTFTFARDVFDPQTKTTIADGFARFVDTALADLDQPIHAAIRASSATHLVSAASVLAAAPSTTTPASAGATSEVEPLAARVQSIFARVLGHEVGVDDDFFGAGGHSLLAVRLCSTIERELGTRLAVAAVFDAPTPRMIAHLLCGVAAAPAPAPAPAMPTAAMPTPPANDAPPVGSAGYDTVVDTAAADHRAPREPAEFPRPTRLWLRRAPLSFAQRRLWVLEQLGDTGTAYILTSAYELYGLLDLDALQRALHATADRHEILRTRYVTDADDSPEQIVDRVPKVDLVIVDLRDDDLAADEVNTRIRAFTHQPFDLATEHPWRGVLAQLTDGHAVLAIAVHHIATDGESQSIILRDLVAAYNEACGAATTMTPSPALQYADHAVWQHARAAGGALDRALDYWVERMHPLPEPLQLPTTRQRPSRVSGSGSDVVVRAGNERRERVDAFARAHRTTPFAVMLTAYEILLHRLTARTDIVVGIPITDRTMDADTNTVGFYVNTVPIRVALDPSASVHDALGMTKRAVADALGHAEAPLDLLIDRLDLPRDASSTPLVQTMFSMQDQADKAPQFDGLLATRRRIGVGGSAKFDLSLIASVGEDIEFYFEYRDDVFDRAAVTCWSQHYVTVLDAMLADQSDTVASLPVVDAVTEQWLVEGCNRTRTDYPRASTVTALFEATVASHGDQVAVVEGDRSVTYNQLQAEASILASRLRHAGVVPGDRVGLDVARSTELVVAMIATLQCGAAYIPLDPTYPEARRSMMTSLARVAAIVDISAVRTFEVKSIGRSTPESESGHAAIGPLAAAYVMFTSGSTGTPKGVVVPHRAIVRLVRDTDYIEFGDDLVVAHLSNTSFDAATFEIWGALLNGGRLVVLDSDTVTSPIAFAEAILRHEITTMFVTTALFNVMAREAPGAFEPLRHLLFGGEAADPQAVRDVLANGCPENLVNVYGPTESTTFASWHRIERLPERAVAVPIGRPIANTTLHVVDASGRPVPPLVDGELLIGGDGLALGYLDDHDLTTARFVPDTFASDPTARLYRTGDIVKRRLDGSIEFVGRKDHQVKIRGFRIELGDIESALRAVDGVTQAHATVRRRAGDDAEVLAYVVGAVGSSLAGDAVRNTLRASLPGYLVPAAVMVLDVLPMNANGKIDRDALPAPTPKAPVERAAAPVTDALERRLLDIWCEILGVVSCEVDDNFFEVGGNSIRAVRFFATVERELGARLALSTLFASPTVRSLASVLRAEHPQIGNAFGPGSDQTKAVAGTDRGPSLLVTLRAGDPSRHTPVYCVHPAGGQVFAYAPILPSLAAGQPVIGITEYGWGDRTRRLDSVEAYAARYVDEITTHHPRGPLALAGYSLGGLLAFEMARLLRDRGRAPEVVLLLDAAPFAREDDDVPPPEPNTSKLRRRLARDGVFGLAAAVRRIAHRTWAKRVAGPAEARRDRRTRRSMERRGVAVDPLLIGRESERAGMALRRSYRPEHYGGRIVCFRAVGVDPEFPIADYSYRWNRVVDVLEIVDVPGNHADEESMLTQPHAAVLGAEIAAVMAEVDAAVRARGNGR